ncbi:uncharacterized protein LOC114268572 [Camellia sinensis]|uniref:uncharacterized protein LOC114268572 n=1 Tax=Camellia sinensis TaxID=4442 RepID=UPI00103612BC|nr:uncharacterized protein LOC114268572 [Camellia sinensis]
MLRKYIRDPLHIIDHSGITVNEDLGYEEKPMRIIDMQSLFCHWWRVCKNGLATKENLFKRNCAESGYCPICNKQLESVEHLLFECDWVRPVWFRCEFGYKVSWSETQSILKWSCQMMENFTDSKECNLSFSSIAWIGWFVWKERNEFVFSQKPVDPLSTLHRAGLAKKEFDARSISQGTDHSHRLRSPQQREDYWKRPAAGNFKINCDVAIHNGSDCASIAAILWDSNGRLLDGVVKKIVCSSSLQGEALACRLACQLALARNLAGVEIEGDNKSVIHLSVSELDPPWDCGAIFFDIKHLAQHLNLTLSWRPRAANKAAHWVAQASLRNALPLDWLSFPPLALMALLRLA